MKRYRLLLWLPVPVLLYLAARQVDWGYAAVVITRLRWWHPPVLALVNALFFALVAGRWAYLLRRSDCNVRLWPVAKARLVGFAVSYLTPGPQIGGEPAQVRHLVRKTHVSTETAIGSVVLDRMVEMIGNFGFLAVGVAVLLTSQVWEPTTSLVALSVPVVAGLLPIVYLVTLSNGRTPLCRLLRGTRLARFARRPLLSRLLRSEEELARRLHQDPRMVLVPAFFHAGVLVMSFVDTAFVLAALGLRLSLEELVIVLTGLRLAFLLPLPGGLGSLEASLVAVFSLLGHDPAFAFGLAVYIRVRDILVASLGLLFLHGALAPRGNARPTAGRKNSRQTNTDDGTVLRPNGGRSLGSGRQSAYHGGESG